MKIKKVLYAGVRLEAFKTIVVMGFDVDVLTFTDAILYTYLKEISEKVDLYGKSWFVDRKRGKSYTINLLDKILSENQYDVMLSVGFPYIIPKQILSKHSNTVFLNSHPHILPKWKGYNCIKESFNKGEKEFGATLHYMTEKVDEGEIISQYKIRVETEYIEVIYDLVFSTVEPLCIAKGFERIKNI